MANGSVLDRFQTLLTKIEAFTTVPSNVPLELKADTMESPLVSTSMRSSESTATEDGSRRLPGPGPWPPSLNSRVPFGSKTWT